MVPPPGRKTCGRRDRQTEKPMSGWGSPGRPRRAGPDRPGSQAGRSAQRGEGADRPVRWGRPERGGVAHGPPGQPPPGWERRRWRTRCQRLPTRENHTARPWDQPHGNSVGVQWGHGVKRFSALPLGRSPDHPPRVHRTVPRASGFGHARGREGQAGPLPFRRGEGRRRPAGPVQPPVPFSRRARRVPGVPVQPPVPFSRRARRRAGAVRGRSDGRPRGAPGGPEGPPPACTRRRGG